MLPEKRTDRVGAAMMASTHIYDLAAAAPAVPPPVRRGGGGLAGEGTVELALDPSELDLVDTDAMAVRYEQTLREQQSQLQKEDLSDMLAEHVARQKVSQVLFIKKRLHKLLGKLGRLAGCCGITTDTQLRACEHCVSSTELNVKPFSHIHGDVEIPALSLWTLFDFLIGSIKIELYAKHL